MSFHLQPFRALVIGSSGTIGAQWVRHLKSQTNLQHIALLSRQTHPYFDLSQEASIERAAQDISQEGPFNCIIDATGALVIELANSAPNQTLSTLKGPEKNLASLNSAQLMMAFIVNTIGPALLLKNLASSLAKGPCVYAKLSARVGSIEDNQKGGWYGYRSSKAAFNMMLQTAAIELQRKNPETKVVALQPGTVLSSLSKEFIHSSTPCVSVEDSVAGMWLTLQNSEVKKGAQFLDYKGQSIPW